MKIPTIRWAIPEVRASGGVPPESKRFYDTTTAYSPQSREFHSPSALRPSELMYGGHCPPIALMITLMVGIAHPTTDGFFRIRQQYHSIQTGFFQHPNTQSQSVIFKICPTVSEQSKNNH